MDIEIVGVNGNQIHAKRASLLDRVLQRKRSALYFVATSGTVYRMKWVPVKPIEKKVLADALLSYENPVGKPFDLREKARR